MVALFRLVFPLIRKYRRLFVSMMLTSALGIALMVGLWGVYANLVDSMDSYVEEYGYPDVSITCGTSRNSLDDLKDIEGVLSVETRFAFDVSIDLCDKTVTARVFTFDEEEDFEGFYVREKCLSDTLPNVRVEYKYAKENGIKAGDILTLDYYTLDYEVCVGEIISRPDTMSVKQNRFIWGESTDFGYIFMDENDFAVAKSGFYNRIFLKCDGTRSNNLVLSDVLDALPSSVRVYESYTYEDSLLAKSKDLNFTALRGLNMAVPPIFFTITMLVVFLFMLQILNQERKNIGIFKALGYKSSEIIPLYLFLGVIIAVLAAFIGVPLGYGITSFAFRIYENSFTLPYVIPHLVWLHILISAGGNLLVCIFASLLSVLKVLRVEPKEAMSAQGSSLRNPGILKRLHMNASLKLSASSILRNWKRFLFSALCMASSVMLILASLYFYAAGERVKRQTFMERLSYDAAVYYVSPVGDSLMKKYEATSNITESERILISSLSVSSLGNSSSVTIFGLSDTKMMKIPDEGGRGTLDLNSGGIILDKKTADILKVKKGDSVTIADAEIPVLDISRQYISSLCYMEYDYMSSLGINCYGGVLCNTEDVSELMDFASNTPSFASVELTRNLKKYTNTCFRTVYIGVYIVIAFSLITGFIIIYNISAISLKESEHKLAVMKTLGVRQRQISLSRFFESVLQYLAALMVGIPLGNGIAVYILKGMESSSWEYPYYYNAVLGLYTALISFTFVAFSHMMSMNDVRKWNLADLTRSKE